MSKLCPNCGYENPEANEKCAMCNTPLKSFGEASGGQTQENLGGKAVSGLLLVRWAAILAIVTFVVSIAINLALLGTVPYTAALGGLGAFSTGTSFFSSTGQITAAFWYAVIAAISQFVILFISSILLYMGFGRLTAVNSRLRTGRTGSLLYIVGLLLVLISIFGLLASLLPLLSQISSGNPAAVSTLYGLIGLLVLVFIGAILALIGVIMIAIGLYRIGDIFNDTSSKVGGILYFLINIVGAILMVIGISSIINKIRGASPSTGTEPEQPSL